MRHTIGRTLVAAMLLAGVTGVTACHYPRHEGPAQHVGREIDHAADKAGDVVEDAGHKVNRALPGD